MSNDSPTDWPPPSVQAHPKEAAISTRIHLRANFAAVLFLVAGIIALALPASAGALVYWANYTGDTIGRANLDGSGTPDESFIAGAEQPRGVAVDGHYVYWDNYTTGTIGRANLDGTAPDQSFIAGASFPDGVAVDAEHVYWANSEFGVDTIGRADLDGNPASVDQSFITGASGPQGVAVDGQHVYWANTSNGTIGRANLDGTAPDQSFITGADHPDGLAVDAQHVYWANSNSTTIGRADLDGNPASVDQSFIAGVSSPTGLAVDAEHVYWNNAGTGIARANLDGTGADLSFIPTTDGDPVAVAVDSIACASTLAAPSASCTEPAGDTGSSPSPTGSSPSPTGSSASPPDTKITKTKIDSRKGKATFKFKATGEKAGFRCALVKKHKRAKFKKCSSPMTYEKLMPGRYTFEVRAVGPGGTDPSPAKKRFRIG